MRQALSVSASFFIAGSEVIHDLFQCRRNADVRRMMRPSGNANSANKTFSSYFCADLYKRTAICAIIRMPQPVWCRLPFCLTPRAKGWHEGLSVHQEVEYKSVQKLWKQLKALPQKYSCNYHIPKSDKVKTFLAVFNQLSGDKVSEAEIIKNMNSIPPFEVARLYKLVMNEIKAQQKSAITQDGATLERGFREISRIALRNGILPSALFFHVINEKSKRIKYGVDEV